MIPTVGRSAVLAAVNSVLRQTHTQVEVIVVYDGAGEMPLQLPDDERVKAYSTVTQTGVSAARALGSSIATGKYLALLDDDDTWEPTKLEVQLATLQQLGPAGSNTVCASRVRLVNADGRGALVVPTRLIRPDEDASEYLFVRRRIRWGEAVIHPSTLLCERELAAQIPWLPMSIHEDWDWLLRLTAATDAQVIMVDAPLVNVTETVGSASRSTKWRESLSWVTSSASLTRRQKADLLLCTTAAYARAAGDRMAVARIATRALTHGPPGLPACLFFAAFQILPPAVLTRLARFVSTRRRHSALRGE